MHKRLVAISIVVLILLALFYSLHTYPEDSVRVLVVFSEEPLTIHAQRAGIKPTDPSLDQIRFQLQKNALERIEELRAEGVRCRVIDILLYTVYGVVIETYRAYMPIIERQSDVRSLYFDTVIQTSLGTSSKLVRAEQVHILKDARGSNLTGEGVTVAIIDTGVDYNHPDLGGGYGDDFKIIGGYDFVDDDDDPMDSDGHGTRVAGIIAADGIFKGVAPKAKLLAYRVVSRFRGLLSLDVVRALDRAVSEGAEIVNLSLGTEVENEVVRKSVRNAVRAGLVVVAAAGNSGPYPGTIAEPAAEPTVLTVGASNNNVSQSLAAKLDIPGFQERLPIYPLNGSVAAPSGVSGRIVFVDYARESDVKNLDLRGAIAVAERGGPMGELVFFSTKEANVADRGALGLIIFNNLPGIFSGTLIHQQNPPTYSPRIPVVSMSREDGLNLLKIIQGKTVNGSLTVKVLADQVALYSSRGPSSPFTLKPDMVAPGSYINSTSLYGSYSVMSGTSFSAPHTAGAAALLLQAYPDIEPDDVASILTESSMTMLNLYGRPFSVFEQGSGRLDIYSAVTSKFYVKPHSLIFQLAEHQPEAFWYITVKSLVEEPLNITISSDWRFNITSSLEISSSQIELDPLGERILNITARLKELSPGVYEGRIRLYSSDSNMTVPVVTYINEISVESYVIDGKVKILLNTTESWSSARVRIIDPEGSINEVILLPSENSAEYSPKEVGEYYVDVEALSSDRIIHGRAMFNVSKISPQEEKREESQMISNDLIGSILLYAAILIIIMAAYFLASRAGRARRFGIQVPTPSTPRSV